jgi:hypothetical protein
MGIGNRVRAAEEAKAEQALNKEGKLSSRQHIELAELGLSIAEARSLMSDGIVFDQIYEIGEARARHAQANVTASQRGSAEIAAAVTEGIAQARTPIPENKQHHDKSDHNPFGDVAQPRPGLKCAWWWGMIDDKTKTVSNTGYEIDPADLTVWEQLALNTLPPGKKVIKRLDGAELPVSITEKLDDHGKVKEMLLGLPANVIGKAGENKNMVPDITEIVRRMTGHDFRREELSTEETLRLMAAHRAKNYDVPRKAVAA